MAKAQIKPTASGSFTDVTGKATTGISNLPPYAQHQALYASNLFTLGAGTGDRAKTATKAAAAVGRLLQWV